MTMITCPECNKEISDSAKACPACGYPLQTKSGLAETSNFDADFEPTPAPEFNTPGLISFLVGLIGLFIPISVIFIGVLFGIVGFILGIIGVTRYEKRGFAITGIVLSSIVFVISIIGLAIY